MEISAHADQNTNHETPTIRLFSLPRGGSTYFAAELFTHTGYQYLAEPIRRVQKDIKHVFYPGKLLSFSDITTLMSSEKKEDIYIKELFLALQKDTYLIKETDGIFWIQAIKEYFKDQKIILLHRDLLGVFISHAQINNIWEFWKYPLRIESLINALRDASDIPRFKAYYDIYQMAKQSSFKGSKEMSLLLAHLGVQALELKFLKNQSDIISVDYHNLVNGKQQYIDSFLQENYLPDNKVDRVSNEGFHSTHSTKHIVGNDKKWIQFFSKDDMLVMRKIFQEQFKDLVAEEDLLKIEGQKTEQFLFQDIYGKKFDEKPDFRVSGDIAPSTIPFSYLGEEILVDSMPVLNSDFCLFLNACIEQGIEMPHKAIYYHYTVKEMDIDPATGKYLCNKVSEKSPVVFVSALTSALYALYKNAKLGNIDLYRTLHQKFITNESIGNIAENFPSTINCGKYPPIGGLYDLFGNVKELCVKKIPGDETKIYTYGGSYKEEQYIPGNGATLEYPLLVGDENIGFRLFFDKKPSTTVNVFDLIKDLLKSESIDYFKSKCNDIITLASL